MRMTRNELIALFNHQFQAGGLADGPLRASGAATDAQVTAEVHS